MEKEVSSQKAASTEKRVLAYSDLGFAVHDKKTKQLKSILQDVSGRVERARVLAFAKPADQKRALVSRVLVRRCARVGLVDAYEGVTRTARGKPYAVARGAPRRLVASY